MMISRRGGPDAAAPAGGSMMKKAGIACFAAIAILIVYSAVTGIGGGGGDAQHAAGAASAAAVQITSGELAAAYQANRAAAQQRFGNRPLEVTGAVMAVQMTIADRAFLVLKGNDPILGLKADLAHGSEPEASSLSKGQVVTVRCTGVGEAMGSPMLKACELLMIDSAVALASAALPTAPAPWKAIAAGGQTRIGIST